MIFNTEYIGVYWSRAISSVLRDSRNDSRPILIIRAEDLHREFRIWRNLKYQHKAIYVRMGPAHSMAFLFDEILIQLSSQNVVKAIKRDRRKAVGIIASIVCDQPLNTIIVIDNCQQLSLRGMSYLIGLILHTKGKAQFVLITAEEKLTVWVDHFRSSPVGQLFFQILQNGHHINL